MSHAIDLRALARDHAARLRTLTRGDVRVEAILAAAARDTGVGRVAVAAGDPLLDGGDAVYDPEPRMIWYNRDVGPELAAMHQAHEYAHVWLGHAGRAHCDTRDLDPEAPEEPVPLGVHRVEGYGPKERRERDANVFARELLLPTDLLRRWFIEDDLTAPDIATRVGVPLGVVYHQLAYAVLVGDLPMRDDEADASARDAAHGDVEAASMPSAPHTSPNRRPNEAPGATSEALSADTPAALSRAAAAYLEALDESQHDAACVAHGPLLVEAGPGTGKTRTLVGRVLHLLSQGVDPSTILALTFSNKAAEEMRERVARVAPAAAPLIWMGTFHAFGLELLRKYGTRIGLSTNPPVVDLDDGMFLLEGELSTLALVHYQNLPEPTRYLRSILAAISRAKDELATPADYHAAAQAMRAAATTDAHVTAAEKALEVAHVYDVYQTLLARDGALDFGDLIARSVALLTDPALDVGERVRAEYRHVLVDEYQDVNRASAVLLRAIVGEGRGLWVVGDARQSIYRFRGAAPVNMARFADDFPGASVRPLRTNYRSQPAVVDVVSAYAAAMPSLPGVAFEAWTPKREQTTGVVRMEIAADAAAEGVGIAAEVQRHRARGVAYREQAVLCRSHTQLARIGAHLEAAGVPVLYLGDLFERPEVRDLLALLSLACHGDGHGLVRVARFPEYAIPLADVRATLRFADEGNVAFPQALARAAALPSDAIVLTDAGRAGLARLAEHLDALCYGSEAWTLLSRYLLERSEYLRRLAADPSLLARQRRLAIYQFLNFAYEQRHRGKRRAATTGGATGPNVQPVARAEDPKRAFLRFVRRLAMVGEDTQLRYVPAWASRIDAVRLMTVHASKGLEFPVVFVPRLVTGSFPANAQWDPCPVPPALLRVGETDRDDRVERAREEECLLFVAVSRAQDALVLSRALTYAKNNRRSSASSLLGRLGGVVSSSSGSDTVTWPALANTRLDEEGAPFDAPVPDTFAARALDTYLTCPRRYLYEQVLALRAASDDRAYRAMHGCVYRVLDWVTAETGQGRVIDPAEATRRLDETWQQRGPRDHPYEAFYRSAADALLTTALTNAAQRRGRGVEVRPTWSLALTNGTVTLVPDEVELVREVSGSVVVARTVKTKRPTASEEEKPLYALLHRAAAHAYAGAAPRVEITYLSTGTTVPVSLTTRTVNSRVQKYDDAMAAIARGEFPANPDDYTCPRCAQYFICPSASDGVS